MVLPPRGVDLIVAEHKGVHKSYVYSIIRREEDLFFLHPPPVNLQVIAVCVCGYNITYMFGVCVLQLSTTISAIKHPIPTHA